MFLGCTHFKVWSKWLWPLTPFWPLPNGHSMQSIELEWDFPTFRHAGYTSKCVNGCYKAAILEIGSHLEFLWLIYISINTYKIFLNGSMIMESSKSSGYLIPFERIRWPFWNVAAILKIWSYVEPHIHWILNVDDALFQIMPKLACWQACPWSWGSSFSVARLTSQLWHLYSFSQSGI